MRTNKLIGAMLTAAIFVQMPQPSYAVIPVLDAASVAHLFTTVNAWQEQVSSWQNQVKQLDAQIKEQQAMVKSVSGKRLFANVLNSLSVEVGVPSDIRQLLDQSASPAILRQRVAAQLRIAIQHNNARSKQINTLMDAAANTVDQKEAESLSIRVASEVAQLQIEAQRIPMMMKHAEDAEKVIIEKIMMRANRDAYAPPTTFRFGQ